MFQNRNYPTEEGETTCFCVHVHVKLGTNHERSIWSTNYLIKLKIDPLRYIVGVGNLLRVLVVLVHIYRSVRYPNMLLMNGSWKREDCQPCHGCIMSQTNMEL